MSALGLALAVAASAPASGPLPADLEYWMCRASAEEVAIEDRWHEYEYLKTDVKEQDREEEGAAREELVRYIHRSRWGVPVNELLERNGVRLRPADAEDQSRRWRERMGQLDRDPAERRRSVESEVGERRERLVLLNPPPGAFELSYLGLEWIEGHPCHVISLAPRPGFVPASSDEKGLRKLVGLGYIDAERLFFRRLELDVIASLSMKWGALATLTPGSRIVVENREIEPGLPMTSRFDVDLKLRILFLVRHSERKSKTYRGFKHVVFADGPSEVAESATGAGARRASGPAGSSGSRGAH